MKGLAALLVVLQLLLMIPRQTEAQRCRCGKVNRRARFSREIEPHIFGPRAERTEVNEYPWQVGVVRRYSRSGKPHCGGSIIAPRYVLTAAHCTSVTRNKRIGRTFSPREIQVVVGEHNIGDRWADRRAVSRILQHPYYQYAGRTGREVLHYDFSIVTLARSIRFSYRMSPICLPASAHSQYTGRTATVSGWGRTSWEGPQPQTLLETTMQVRPNRRCETSQQNFYSHICAYGYGSGVCHGDSGGPMSVIENGRYRDLLCRFFKSITIR